MNAFLEAIAAMPKEWVCTTTFSDGVVRTLAQPTEAMANAHANGQRRYVGKVVAPGVTCVSVVVSKVTK